MNALAPVVGRLAFGRVEQAAFLDRLASLTGGDLPLRSALELLLGHPQSGIERELARRALHNISCGLPFATGYREIGGFPRDTVALLIAGEERQGAGDLLQLALRGYRDRDDSPWRLIVLGNLRWLLTLSVVSFIAVFLYRQRTLFNSVLGDELTEGRRLVFAVGGFLHQHGLAAVLAAAGLALGLALLLRRETGPLRDRLDQWPPFSDYRFYFSSRLVPQFACLSAIGLPPLEAINTLLRVYSGRYERHRLHTVRTAIAGGAELAEAFGQSLLDRSHRSTLRVLCDAWPGQTSRSFERLADIVQRDFRARCQRHARFLCGLCIALSALLGYGIIDTIYAAPVL